MQTIYLTPYGNHSINKFRDYTPVAAEFIHTRTIGDFNRIEYSDKKQSSTRNKTRSQVFFIPAPGADPSKIKNELKRGRTFFDKKEGILFGAYYELTKLGQIITISV